MTTGWINRSAERGYSAVARVQRSSGNYVVDQTTNDLISILNDFHKGRHTGPWWSWFIDTSAIIGILIALTGFVLIFFLRMKRVTGIAVASAGLLFMLAFYWIASS